VEAVGEVEVALSRLFVLSGLGVLGLFDLRRAWLKEKGVLFLG